MANDRTPKYRHEDSLSYFERLIHETLIGVLDGTVNKETGGDASDLSVGLPGGASDGRGERHV